MVHSPALLSIHGPANPFRRLPAPERARYKAETRYPASVLYLCFAYVPGLMSRTGTDQRHEQAVSVTGSFHNGR